MDVVVNCPHCGARTTAEALESTIPGFVICPNCQKEIPLQHGADVEPPQPAD